MFTAACFMEEDTKVYGKEMLRSSHKGDTGLEPRSHVTASGTLCPHHS